MRGHRPHRLVALIAAAAPGIAVLVGAAPAAAATSLSAINVAPQSVRPGQTITATVALRGGRSMGVGFLLSPRRHAVRGTLSLGTRRVKASRARTARVRLRVPRSAPPAVEYLLACAARSRGRCRSGAQPIAVIARPRPARAHIVPAPGAQTAPIGPQGGTLSATAPRGVRVTLSVPPGALAQGTAITMTPLHGSGFPGGLLAAVRLSPAGLSLAHPATLSFSRSAAAGVGFGPDGNELHLDKVGSGGLALSALGGAGELSASRSRLRTFARAHVAADPLAELEQLLVVRAPSSRGARAASASTRGTGGWDSQEAIDAYALASANEIEGLALGGAFVSALADYESWDPMAASLSAGDPDLSGVRAQVRTALIQGGGRETDTDGNRCAAAHELSELTNLLALENGGAALRADSLTAAAGRAISDCFRFDLQIDSQSHHDPSSDGQTFDFHFQGKDALHYGSVQDPGLVGVLTTVDGTDGPGEFASASASASGSGECVEDGSSYTNTMTMTSADGGDLMASATIPTPVNAVPISGVRLTLNSDESETYRFTTVDPAGDPRCSSTLTETNSFWWNPVEVGAVAGSDAELAPDGDAIVIPMDTPTDDERARNPALIAEKTLPPFVEAGWSGTTTIRLVHDPSCTLYPSLPPSSGAQACEG